MNYIAKIGLVIAFGFFLSWGHQNYSIWFPVAIAVLAAILGYFALRMKERDRS